MGQAFKMAMKIFLLLAGSVMLVGGGICAVTDAYFAVASKFRPGSGFGIGFPILLAAVASLIAWAGWWAIKFSGIGQSKRSAKEAEPEANGEAGK